MRRLTQLCAVSTTAAISLSCAHFAVTGKTALKLATPAQRLDAIHRAHVWMRTDIPSMDLRAGPRGPGAFAPEELVACTYVDRPQEGHSPKFYCSLGEHDEIKVKYGADNGEVYGEVAATRLLWALGFGADRMYPVRIQCTGCPPGFRGPRAPGNTTALVEPTAVERKMAGHAIEDRPHSGWAWPELDLVDEKAGGAPRAERDALRLIASVMQHTDTKPDQQRLMCLPDSGGGTKAEECSAPFMMINDLGLTFGHANLFNRAGPGAVNFREWSATPVWANDSGRCVANLDKSWTGTLDHPVISEAGRSFLAGLITQLSDAQLHDLFDVSRFERRSHHSADEWVGAFKRKRDQIVQRTCPQ